MGRRRRRRSKPGTDRGSGDSAENGTLCSDSIWLQGAGFGGALLHGIVSFAAFAWAAWCVARHPVLDRPFDLFEHVPTGTSPGSYDALHSLASSARLGLALCLCG